MSTQQVPTSRKRRKKVTHRSNHYYRTKIKDAIGRREKIFARAWEKENQLIQRFTFGGICSKLDELMVQNNCLIPVSQEAATAAATVVQWLGTNIGFTFLETTLREAGYNIVQTKKYLELQKRANLQKK